MRFTSDELRNMSDKELLATGEQLGLSMIGCKTRNSALQRILASAVKIKNIGD